MSARVSAVQGLAIRLQKSLDSATKANDVPIDRAASSTDLVARLEEEVTALHATNDNIQEENVRVILRCLSSASKSLRLLRRRQDGGASTSSTSSSWTALHDRVTRIAEQLQQHQQQRRLAAAAAAAARDDETASRADGKKKASHVATATATAATAAAVSSSKSSSNIDGAVLPRSVHEYRERLRSQKKEMYKDPPVLPPHSVRIEAASAPLPTRKSDRTLKFQPGRESDASTIEFIHKFRPNLTPAEVLRGGAFGGTYFRPIVSAVTNQKYTAKEVLSTSVKPEWINGMDVKLQLASSTYRDSVNRYGVKCGGSLGMWESSGWISDADPYGWFQWYCRFYQGRRCTDDARQISRWLGVAGPTGRFRTQLCNKILRASTSSASKTDRWNDATISPVIRQTLVHWGLEITQEMVEAQAKRTKI